MYLKIPLLSHPFMVGSNNSISPECRDSALTSTKKHTMSEEEVAE
jgi:hypothetical protein